MDHSNLKHLGARRGEIGRHTLKLGSVIVKIDQIAAIMMAEDHFHPNDSDALRKAKSFCPPIIFLGASLAVVGGVSWGLSAADILGTAQKTLFAALGIGGVILSLLTHGVKYGLDIYANRSECFFRLMIETSGGTRFAAVDYELKKLSDVREILFRKLETGDPKIQAAFDFEKAKLDIYN